MSEIQNFFAAWGMADAEERNAAIQGAVTSNITYADPRTEAPLTGLDALSAYVGMFTEMAPGATASVVKEDTTGGMARVTVAFRMADGKEQLGQYFVEPASGKIARMTGFVGTGAPS